VLNFELYHHLAFRLIIEIEAAIADGFPDDGYVMTRCPAASSTTTHGLPGMLRFLIVSLFPSGW